MKRNPPAAADAPAAPAFHGDRPRGWEELRRQSPRVALGRAPAEAFVRPIVLQLASVKRENGWLFTTKTGLYGTDHIQRARILATGLGANRPQDAVYPTSQRASLLEAYEGSRKYALRLEKGQLPPVKGFWSLTMHGEEARAGEKCDRRRAGRARTASIRAQSSWLVEEKSMLHIRTIGLCAGLVMLAGAPFPASAQDAIAAPGQKTIGQTQATKGAMIPSLAVINSRGATLQGNVLTMTEVGSNSIVFADRPYRAAGHVLTRDFLKEWDEGSDSFAKDPPNATISVLSENGDSVEDAVVVLKSPKLDGGNLTFEVSVLEGSLSKATGPASLFIDWFAARGYGGRGFVAGGYHGGYAGGWHGAWYGHPAGWGAGAAAVGVGLGAAAVGAAAASAYYHPYAYPYYAPPPAACGYYPYPPCY